MLQNFQLEHAEDINHVYLLSQIFESVFDLFTKDIHVSKRIGLTHGIIECISSCSIDKRDCALLFYH